MEAGDAPVGNGDPEITEKRPELLSTRYPITVFVCGTVTYAECLELEEDEPQLVIPATATTIASGQILFMSIGKVPGNSNDFVWMSYKDNAICGLDAVPCAYVKSTTAGAQEIKLLSPPPRNVVAILGKAIV